MNEQTEATKTEEAPQETKGEVVTKEDKLPANIDFAADAGAGMEDVTQEDMMVPFIKCAQALSDEIDSNNSKFIEGLDKGDFFNTATQKVYKGATGFLWVPACYERQYLEWIPREQGGGFAGSHDAAILDDCTSPDGLSQFLPNGNEIVVTGTWFGLVIDPQTGGYDQAVIALAKSQLKKSRQLMTQLRTLLIETPKGKVCPALFYSTVQTVSVPESNDKGNWMGWHFKLGNKRTVDLPNGEEIYQAARSLSEAVHKGIAKTIEPDEPASGSEEDIPF